MNACYLGRHSTVANHYNPYLKVLKAFVNTPLLMLSFLLMFVKKVSAVENIK